MRIKRATIQDLKEIAKLRRETIEKINAKILPETDIKILKKINSLTHLKKRIKQAKMFILKDRNKIVGTIDLKKNEVKGVYVHKDYQGTGLGSKLLNFIEEYAKKHGHRLIWLECNKSAYGFYTKRGYKCVERESQQS
jgi:GNAT superfamily N-acetyltransferase